MYWLSTSRFTIVGNLAKNKTIKLDQIGMERSASLLLTWNRITGGMGRSDSKSLRKEGDGKGGKYLE